MRTLPVALVSAATLIFTSSALSAQRDNTRQALTDAWWTGPMLANSAAALPHGHFVVEPYLYDVVSHASFDGAGARHATPTSHGLGSLTYIIYGLTDKISLGVVPVAGFNSVHNAPSSSGVGIGDASLLMQYSLTQFHQGSRVPATAISVQETFPTGKYDRLGTRLSDGFGRGAYSTTVALYSQMYFWLPNGRIFRTRLNASENFSRQASIEDASVYGTAAGFRGHASPGNSSTIDFASEYSATKRWVVAVDLVYQGGGPTHVTGYDALASASAPQTSIISLASPSSRSFGVAPAVEYNVSSQMGVLLGARIIAAGRNTSSTITPAIAVNIVH